MRHKQEQQKYNDDYNTVLQVLHRMMQDKLLLLLLLNVIFQEILAIEPSLALSDLVERIAHQHGTQRRFARTVRSHDGVCLTIAHQQIDAFQYLFASYRGMQVFNF